MLPSQEEAEQGPRLSGLGYRVLQSVLTDTRLPWCAGYLHVCPYGSTARLAVGRDGSPTSHPIEPSQVLPAFPQCWVAPFGHFLKMGKLSYGRTRDVSRSEGERKKRTRGGRHQKHGDWGAAASSCLCEQNYCNNPAKAVPPETPTPEKTGMDIDSMLQGWARGRDLWQGCQDGEQGSLPGEGALGPRALKDE